ncbi:hypothetical protein PIB30_069572 [Stylosanthes scabra]|uniref:Beta-glucosidase n=1 Tax=Stylosanthes scabra TaxID=79078 RepID=A0ABU6YMM6_9FABA|nr:hypothetical protein [Stylosanthes scabra]
MSSLTHQEDIDLMEDLGVNTYRFSISWARILPKGRFGKVNVAGINYYNRLIDALLLKGIEPFVTLSHFDFPQELEDRYGGWLSSQSQTKYQTKQGGKIGIVLHINCFEPFSDSTADQLATIRAQAFTISWILDPVMFGKYPREMEMILGPILPKFSRIEKEKLKRGVDFIGVNHYSSYYIQDCSSPECQDQPGTSSTEGLYLQTAERNGVPIGELTPFEWLVVYPQGMKKTVTYLKDRYNNTPIYITENGYGYSCDSIAWEKEYRNDITRINYLAGHLENLAAAIREGVDVRGYFAWSLLDNFEWKYGQSVRFGLYHVDYDTLRRTPRSSATWYKNFIATHKTQSIMPGYDDDHNDKELQSNIKLITY